MKIQYRTGNNGDVLGLTPGMKENIEKKVNHYSRVFPEDSLLDCSWTLDNREFKVKLCLRSTRYSFEAHGENDDFYQAFTLAFEKLRKQIRRKHNEQVTVGKRNQEADKDKMQEEEFLDDFNTLEE